MRDTPPPRSPLRALRTLLPPVLRVRPQLSPRPRPDLRPLFRSRPERRDGGSDGCEHSSPAACARPRPPPPPRGGRRRLPPWREPPSHQGARGPASEGAAWGPRACGLSPGQENGRKSGGARTGVIFLWKVGRRPAPPPVCSPSCPAAIVRKQPRSVVWPCHFCLLMTCETSPLSLATAVLGSFASKITCLRLFLFFF